MKFTTAFTLLACSLAVAAVPTESGMDQSSNTVANGIASTFYRFLRRYTESEDPKLVGEPTYFVVDSD